MEICKLSPDQGHAKILLVTAERVGDALFCIPGIRLLKQYLPTAQLDVLTFSPVAHDLFMGNPDVNTVIIANPTRHAVKIAKRYPLTINLMHEMLRHFKVQPENFVSIGVPDQSQHRTQQVVDFVRSLCTEPVNIPDLHYPLYPQSQHAQRTAALLEQQGIDLQQHILIGLQLGCHRVARRGWKIWNRKRHEHKKVWPMQNYIELAKRLSAHSSNIRFVLTGSNSERYLAKLFLAGYGQAIDLIGKTSILEIAALMDRLKLYITHDTGTMHIACARHTPLVTLFGPTPAVFTGPFPAQEKFTVIAKPSMRAITIDEVLTAVLERL